MIVPVLAEYQTVEIGDKTLAFLRKMLLYIDLAFIFLCVIPIALGILLIFSIIIIQLIRKVRHFCFNLNFYKKKKKYNTNKNFNLNILKNRKNFSVKKISVLKF